jgi:hypothetical protein
MVIKLKGSQISSPITAGSGSNVSNATLVLVQNTTTTNHLVSLQTASAGSAIGEFNCPPNQNIRLVKEPTDEIYAANAGVKLTAIGFSA